jgi:tRNA dimethylallyltransferase
LTVTVIIGPTASGKSALAVARGAVNDAIIINADAMQCYDALPVLTAQPTQTDQGGVPHKLYSALKSDQAVTAASWVEMAAKEIKAALAAGKNPYIVGGTGLYIKALMDGLSPIPDIPDDIRADVRARKREDVYADLQTRDPVMAARLKPGDTQRILRAMEVLESTGESLSVWQSIPPQKPHGEWDYHVVQLRPEKDILERNIRARLAGMIDAGVMDEVKNLSDRIEAGDVPDDALIIMAHGFRNFRNVLQGNMAMDDAIEATVVETRQYTKRQRTWLRHQIRADEIIA